MSSGYATRDKFREACERRYTDIEVPFFGKIRLRSLSAKEKRIVEAKRIGSNGMLDEDRYSSSFGWLCIFMVVDPDEDNEAMFGEMDLDWLNGMDWGHAKPLYEQMNRFAELHEDDEALKKNSTNGKLSSTSPTSSADATSAA